MGQSSNVFAVAMMADGKVLYAVKEIEVTLGGCDSYSIPHQSPFINN